MPTRSGDLNFLQLQISGCHSRPRVRKTEKKPIGLESTERTERQRKRKRNKLGGKKKKRRAVSQSAGPDSDSVCIGIVRYVLQLRCAEGYPHRPDYQTNRRSICGWSVPDMIRPYPNFQQKTAKNQGWELNQGYQELAGLNESAWISQESWRLAWFAILKYVQSTSTMYRVLFGAGELLEAV